MTTVLIIKPQELAQQLGMSKSSLWRWQKAGILPEPIKFGNRVLGWRKATILQWLDSAEEAA
jgi:prophage regulatory protein